APIWPTGWPSRRAGASSRWRTAPSTTRTRARRPTASCSLPTTPSCSTKSPTAVTPTSRSAAMTSTRASLPVLLGLAAASWAVALTIAAGVYELTPLKRECRRRCRESVRSGFELGLWCVGSSIGLMVVLVALGIMSVTWMAVIGVLVLAQKLLPPRASVDVLVALAIVGFGILVAT